MKTKSVESQKINSITSIAMISMCTAIIAVLSQISFPLPSGVPVTLQTFAIALTGYLLGWKAGGISTLVYVLLGLIGAPVFSGLKAGIPVLFGKTGGFIFGFLFMSVLCGLGYEYKRKFHHIPLILFSALGLLLCHAFGVAQFAFLTHMGIGASMLLVSIPYLLKDIVSIIFAYFLALTIRKALLHTM